MQTVLQIEPHDSGGEFRTQGERVLALVQKGVHLFFDNIGRFADAADEQLGWLKNRRIDLFISVEPGDFVYLFFDDSPIRLFIRQHIPRPCDGFIFHGRAFCGFDSIPGQKKSAFARMFSKVVSILFIARFHG